MSYRRPDPPPVRVVPYGRYWPRPLSVLVPLLLVAAGLLVAAVQRTHVESLTCTRDAGTVSCVYQSRLLWLHEKQQLTGEQIASVEWVPYKNKGGERGRTEIFDPAGHPLSAMDGSRDSARQHYDRLQSFLHDPAARAFTWRTTPSVWSLPLAAGLALLGLALLGRGAKRPTSVSLVFDASARTVAVKARYLGILPRRTRWSLAEVKRIKVERKKEQRFTDPQRHPGRSVARIRIEYLTGAVGLLTPWLPDSPLHDWVADELRVEAGLPPAEARNESELLVTTAVSPPHDNRRVLKWWLVSVVVISTVGFGVQWIATRDHGTLEIHCDHRCRFEGMDCRPGGSVAGSYEPGRYVIEVFDPKAPGGWRGETAEVTRAHTTVFHCR